MSNLAQEYWTHLVSNAGVLRNSSEENAEEASRSFDCLNMGSALRNLQSLVKCSLHPNFPLPSPLPYDWTDGGGISSLSQSLQIPSFLTYAKHMRVQAHLLSLLRIEALMEVFLRGKINQQGRLNVNVHGHICDIHSCMHVLLGSIGFSENRDKHSCLNEVNTYTQRSYWLIHWANSNKESSIMHWYLHLLCVTTKRINGCWFSFMSLSTFLKMRMHKSDLCLNLRKQVRSKSV